MTKDSYRLDRYKDSYDWVKVEALQKIRLGRRDWTNKRNLPIEKGEQLLVARDGRGMEFYLENDFLKLVDEDPYIPGLNDEEKLGEKETVEEVEEESGEELEKGEYEEKKLEDLDYNELRKQASKYDDIDGRQGKDDLLKALKEKQEEEEE